jgi:uncharacterized cupin superfamily protein
LEWESQSSGWRNIVGSIPSQPKQQTGKEKKRKGKKETGQFDVTSGNFITNTDMKSLKFEAD